MRLKPEDALQRTCVEWFRWQYPKLKLIAIPNGSNKSRAQAAVMKMTGLVAGVLDLFLITPSDGFHGLWLEAKVVYASGKKNYMSEEQKEFKAYVEDRGYKAVVFYTFEEFKEAVESYLQA